jgi:predicted amidohydrolase
MIPIKISIALLLLSFQSIAQAQNSYALTNVNVIAMNQDSVLMNQTVLIEKGIIKQISPASNTKIDSRFKVVEASGKFLMPGLMDMHAHFFQEQYEDHKSSTDLELKLMLANGLTSVRILAGHPEFLQARSNVANGKWIGPDLTIASPQLVGRWPWGAEFKNFEVVDTPEKATAAVKKFKKEGYDEIKITFMVNRNSYDAIIKTAKEIGIKVTGHVGPRVKLPAALAAGQQIEHMDEFIDMLLPDTSYNHGVSVSDMNIWSKKAWATVPFLDETKIPELAKRVKQSGIYVSPTNYFFLSSFGEISTEESIRQKPDYSFIPNSLKENRWKIRERYQNLDNSESSLEKYRRIRKKLVYELWKAGVPLMAGSDSPEFFLLTGFSIHDELETFVKAGLTPFAALQTATTNTANYLGTIKTKGTIEKGKEADLILLSKNPLNDVRNSRAIDGVFKKGVYYNNEAIQQFLLEAKKLGDQ